MSHPRITILLNGIPLNSQIVEKNKEEEQKFVDVAKQPKKKLVEVQKENLSHLGSGLYSQKSIKMGHLRMLRSNKGMHSHKTAFRKK